MRCKMLCNNCPRKCNINRQFQFGYCKLSNKLRVALACLHYGEEPEISGEAGSGTIFFSGCNLSCVYCQNYNVSNKNFGINISVRRLAEIFKELEEKGANNINLVTPTPHVDKIVSALKIYRPKIPVIYNTSGYERPETIKSLAKYIDIYLTDLKYYKNEISEKYSNCKDYFGITTEAIDQMFQNQPKNISRKGLLKKGVIIRHLVLPSCTDDSIKVLDWIHNNHPSATVSIMGQFTPCYQCKEYPGINRKLKPIEYKRIINYATKLGIKGYMQDLNSATINEIPKFDLSGVKK